MPRKSRRVFDAAYKVLELCYLNCESATNLNQSENGALLSFNGLNVCIAAGPIPPLKLDINGIIGVHFKAGKTILDEKRKFHLADIQKKIRPPKSPEFDLFYTCTEAKKTL